MFSFKKFMESFPPDSSSMPQEVIRAMIPDILKDLIRANGPEFNYNAPNPMDEKTKRQRIKDVVDAEKKFDTFLMLFRDAQAEQADSKYFDKLINQTKKEVKDLFRFLKNRTTIRINPSNRETFIDRSEWMTRLNKLISIFNSMLERNWAAPSHAYYNSWTQENFPYSDSKCSIVGTAPFSAFFGPDDTFTGQDGKKIDLNSEITRYEIFIPLLPSAIRIASKYHTSIKNALLLQYQQHNTPPIDYIDIKNMQLTVYGYKFEREIVGMSQVDIVKDLPNIITPSLSSHRCQKIKSPKYDQPWGSSNPNIQRPNKITRRRREAEELARYNAAPAEDDWEHIPYQREFPEPSMPALYRYNQSGLFFQKRTDRQSDNIADQIYDDMKKNWSKRIRSQIGPYSEDDDWQIAFENAYRNFNVASDEGFVRYSDTVSPESAIYKNTVALLQTPNRCWSIFEDVIDA